MLLSIECRQNSCPFCRYCVSLCSSSLGNNLLVMSCAKLETRAKSTSAIGIFSNCCWTMFSNTIGISSSPTSVRQSSKRTTLVCGTAFRFFGFRLWHVRWRFIKFQSKGAVECSLTRRAQLLCRGGATRATSWCRPT